MGCEVEFTGEFGDWWASLNEAEQESIARVVRLLQDHGPALARPFADTLHGSNLKNMRELRIQHKGRPYRVLYMFDPFRRAILLIGGDKTGDGRWYSRMIPLAEEIYAEYLREIPKPVLKTGVQMAKNFNELLAKMSPERRARVEARVKETIAQMPLEELRNARELTQTQLAEVLQVSQGAISKVERRADMYISTLRSYIRAIGGDLRIQAVFPDGAVEINQFKDIARPSETTDDVAA